MHQHQEFFGALLIVMEHIDPTAVDPVIHFICAAATAPKCARVAK